MPFNLNKVTIAGTMTRDIEIKYTPKGTAVGEVSLAINRKYKTADGESREETTFIECEAWGKTAEIIGEYCGKGHTIYVEGRLKLDTWDDKDTGKKRSKIRVVIEEMKFVSKPRGEEESKPKSNKPAPAAQRPAARPKPAPDPDLDSGADDEDSLPF